MLSRFNLSMRRRSSAFAGTYHYTVFVKTGDRPNAGTDANVYIVLHGENGVKSKEMKLDVLFHDDFERGNLDKFKLKHQSVSVKGGNSLFSAFYCSITLILLNTCFYKLLHTV